jgi:3-methylcrotonyl-CoA carboxylase alpha subunit
VRVLLTRDERDFEAQITPEGSGYVVSLDGRDHEVEGMFGERMLVRIDGRPAEATLRREGADLLVSLRGRIYRFRARDPRAPRLKRSASRIDFARGEIHAPMPGLVVEVLVEEGSAVEAGQSVLVVEAMKMQNALTAPLAGQVSEVRVAPGAAVETGQLLLSIRPEEG